MTGYLFAGISLVALAAVTVAGVQSVRLAETRADLSTARTDLDAANARIEYQSRQADAVQQSLSTERDRAVTSEAQAAKLKEEIARLEGTAADGPVAPVLKDTIRGLQKTATRTDSLFVGRMLEPFRLSVTIDGRLDRARVVRGFRACRDAAATIATELAKRPELVAEPRRVAIRCDVVREGERA